MEIQSVHIETLHDPQTYSRRQIEFASRLAAVLGRGRLVLVEPPAGE